MSRCFLLMSLFLVCGGCGTDNKEAGSSGSSDTQKDVANPKPSGNTTETKDPNSDSKIANGADNVIKILGEGKAEFRGETVAKITDLANQVSKKLSQSGAGNPRKSTLVIEGVSNASFKELKLAAKMLTAFGFANLSLKSGESLTKLPVQAVAHEGKPTILTVTVLAAGDQSFTGLKIEKNGQASFVESGDIEMSLKSLKSRIEDAISQMEKDKGASSNGPLELELTAADKLTATAFTELCTKLDSITQALSKSESVKIRYWPMGLPREEAIEMSLEPGF